MRIEIVGAGPAGLYAAILLKTLRSEAEIIVHEQNPADATFGFGVVFSDDALSFLRADDPQTADLIEPHMHRWDDIVVVHKGEKLVIDGVGFSGIGRLELLRLLQERAAELHVELRFGKVVDTPDRLDTADLVIAADGLNSVVRNSEPDTFGQSLTYLNNRFVWYGADREFDALTQTFIETTYGPMNAHHYAYARGRSTFIVEVTAETFRSAGFGEMGEAEYRQICQECFSDTLDGASLVNNNSVWRRFPVLTCTRWHSGNRVLVGDALHTAHFSIGSGTRLAMEDVQFLARALVENNWDVERALPQYQSDRQPVLQKITGAALRSAGWYEKFDQHMQLEPLEFAHSYICRAGRLGPDRLRKLAPNFTHRLETAGIKLEVAQ